MVDITFIANQEQGYICANSIELRAGTPFGINSPENYTSSYYSGFPLWFKAIPKPGYVLDHFLVNGSPWTNNSEYVVHPTQAATIEAVFKPVQ